MKKLNLDDLKKGKLSKSVVNNLNLLKGGAAPVMEYCHPGIGQHNGKNDGTHPA